MSKVKLAGDDAFLLFSDLAELIQRTQEILHASPNELRERIAIPEAEEIDVYFDQVCNIRESLARIGLKVVFFGRTSGGKSTLINALLGDKALPLGLGHTTHCFIEVSGELQDEDPHYLLRQNQDNIQSKNTVNEEETFLKYKAKQGKRVLESVSPNSLVYLKWPKTSCSILEEDIVLVDTPGLDVTGDLDLELDQFCLDADLFVFVLDSESTLMMREKAFFKKLTERTSKPNIFVVENRWDCTDGEEESTVKAVRQQHCQRVHHFLSTELKIANLSDSMEGQIFFISAKEALLNRLKPRKRNEIASESEEKRRKEFLLLEKCLLQSLTTSALHTKYRKHVVHGTCLVEKATKVLRHLQDKAGLLAHEMTIQRENLEDRILQTQGLLGQLVEKCDRNISEISEFLNEKVRVALEDELENLSLLAQDFSIDYRELPGPRERVFFSRLEEFLVKGLEQSLQARLGSLIATVVAQNRKLVEEDFLSLLPENKREEYLSLNAENQSPEFKVAMHLRVGTGENFKFSPRFRYSLGLFFWLKPVLRHYCRPQQELFRGRAQPSSSRQAETSGGEIEQFSRILAVVLASQNSITGFLLSGLVWRRFFIRLLMCIILTHIMLYIYEKEVYKRRGLTRVAIDSFTNHLKERLLENRGNYLHSINNQVNQELRGLVERLTLQVNFHVSCEVDELALIRHNIHHVAKAEDDCAEILKSTERLLHQFQLFTSKYFSNM